MQFLKPHSVIAHFDIVPGMHVAELHSGSGFFTQLLSEQVGPYGKVYELEGDIFTDENLTLPEQVDRMLISNILFAAPSKPIIFGHAYRGLKQGGKLVLIEWKDDNPINGHIHDHLSAEEVMHLAGMAGFAREKHFNAGDHHYGIVFKKI